MKLNDLQQAYPPIPAALRDSLVRTARTLQEEKPVKKKLSFALVFALLVLLASAGLALSLRYSVEKAVPPKFADKITTIDETYENDYFTMSINDAVSDGMRLILAMHFEPREGAEQVLVFPRLTAQSGDKVLMTDPEAGFEYLDGFWMPEMADNPAGPGNAMLDMVLWEEDFEDTAAIREEITWTLTLHTLKPNWPITHDQYTSKGYVDLGGAITHDQHNQLFADAYQNKEILLTYGDNTLEYAANLPVPKGMKEEEYYLKRDWERLVLSGAFEEVDRAQRTFTTKPNAELKQFQGEQVVPMEGYEVVVTSVRAAFLGSEYQLLLRHKGGTMDKDDREPRSYFELRYQGAILPSSGFSFNHAGVGLDAENTQEMRGSFSIANLDGVPDEITFVPFTLKEGVQYHEAMNDPGLRFYQEEKAFPVSLK